MEQSENIDALTVALVKAKQQFRPLVPDKENPHFHSRYASMLQCLEVTEGSLAANGLCVTQWLEPGPDGLLACTTQIQHESGQWQRSIGYLPILKPDPQAAGSAITYARRYGYCAALGIAPDEDDDANIAMPARSDAQIITGKAATVSPIKPQNGDNMTVTWGKADSPWRGKTFQEIWDQGSDGHRYLHWLAEDATAIKPAVKKAARSFIDRHKAEPIMATTDELVALRELVEAAGSDLEAYGKELRKVEDQYGGVPAAWVQAVADKMQKRLSDEIAASEYQEPEPVGYATPMLDDEDIPL